MKRVYEKPAAYLEIFASENYCTSACLTLACARGTKNYNGITPNMPWDRNNGEYGIPSYGAHASMDTPDTCADANANRVITSTGSVVGKVQEHNGQQGWISGVFDGYDDLDHSGDISDGDIIYWHTFSSGNAARWNHFGVAHNPDANHPNHS